MKEIRNLIEDLRVDYDKLAKSISDSIKQLIETSKPKEERRS
ncbi:MAG: hypothetical protein QW156_00620 [Candidatus Aenigmatarchaeota archaeon]